MTRDEVIQLFKYHIFDGDVVIRDEDRFFIVEDILKAPGGVIDILIKEDHDS